MRPTYSTCGGMKTVDVITECRIGDKTAAFNSAVHLISGCVKDRNVDLFHLFMVYLTMPSVSHTAETMTVRYVVSGGLEIMWKDWIESRKRGPTKRDYCYWAVTQYLQFLTCHDHSRRNQNLCRTIMFRHDMHVPKTLHNSVITFVSRWSLGIRVLSTRNRLNANWSNFSLNSNVLEYQACVIKQFMSIYWKEKNIFCKLHVCNHVHPNIKSQIRLTNWAPCCENVDLVHI